MVQAARIRPALKVIEGGCQSRSPWLSLPSTVIARSPFSRDQAVFFRLARHDIERALQGRRRQPIFDVWGIVIGQFPPVLNHSAVADQVPEGALTQWSEAHACF